MPNRRKPPGPAKLSFRQADADRVAYRQHWAARLAFVRRLVEPVSADAARRIGVDQRVWWKYEHAANDIDVLALTRFCVEYDVCPRWILLGDWSGLRPELRRAVLRMEAAAGIQNGDTSPHEPDPFPRNSLPCASDG